MTQNAIESQPANEQIPKPPVKFSKLRLFQILGLLDRKFNYVTLEFERSLPLQLWCLISLISKPLFTFKPFLAYFFPKTHWVQLYVGSIFNYVPSEPEYFLGIAGIISGLWGIHLHFCFPFNYLNGKRKNYRLLRFWMKLTLELPVKSDSDYRVAGLSSLENKKFWALENYVNRVWFLAMNWYMAVISLPFCSQLFFVKIEGVEIFSVRYIFFQSAHAVNACHGVFSFVHLIYSINLFYVTCMRFFSRRFERIGIRVQSLSALKTFDKKQNRDLTRLVIEYNRVHYDLIQINDFFKSFQGYNMIYCFSFSITLVFVELLDIDWRLKVIFFTVLCLFYLAVIIFPFIIAQTVTSEIDKTKRRFENIAFHKSVNLVTRQKIELISNLSEKAGFTCFDWWLIDSYTALQISLEFAANLLLFIQAYYYYTKF